ncbi:predicted protein [Coccidioides posadasii str. Silveira]|uniref:Predicted protein n=2 Tax=Coccidioides posadasii TaxID=199306 RepID=E9D450_COCPS|nr:predicted protein [Coccidioides posadasii str. Silveira]KMM66822.1 hypothetical protein CPAG_03160 [Coccidioides posadasii RMSCC 3488]
MTSLIPRWRQEGLANDQKTPYSSLCTPYGVRSYPNGGEARVDFGFGVKRSLFAAFGVRQELLHLRSIFKHQFFLAQTQNVQDLQQYNSINPSAFRWQETG